MIPRDVGGGVNIPDFRQAVEERERLMQREGGLPKENGELRKSLESPQSTSSAGPPPNLPRLPNLPPHFNFNPLMFGGLPSLESLRKEEQHMAEMNKGRPMPMPNIPNIPNISSAGPMPKGPFTQEKLRQMGVINADAFCEICCKEFCNKYFLRVHKLKKHGICSPDLPPEKVQKILNQMAKEAGKTGNPPPPIVRPPMSSGGGPFGGSPDKRSPLPFGPAGFPLRPPGLMSLPPLEPLLPHALKDFTPTTSMGPPQFDNNGGIRSQSRSEHQEVIRINDDSEDGQINRPPPQQFGGDDNDDSMEGRENSSEEEGERQFGNNTAPSEDLQRLQTMIMELNNCKAKSNLMSPPGNNNSSENNSSPNGNNGGAASSTICKVCNKDMENKYFLRAHMMNEHGVLHTEEPPQLTIGQPPDLPNMRQMQDNDDEQRLPVMNGLDMANAQDFAAKFLQQMQKGLGAAGLPPLDGDERSFLERVKSELAAAGGGNGGPGPIGSPSPGALAKKIGGGGGALGGLGVLGGLGGIPGSAPGSAGDKDPNRKPASLSRSYCDICKKELCNKYFMKTHMLKMHGINIEATNSVGVNCHICKKELCSKYFLKVHMQNSHGLMEDGSPLPPHMKENGSGLFPGMFPPLGGPPPELLGLISPGGGPPTTSAAEKADHYFSRLLGEQSELSRERIERQKMMMQKDNNGASGLGHTCSLCGEGFPEIVALQVHIIKSHGAFPPESNPFGSIDKATPPSSEAGDKASPGSHHGNHEDQDRRRGPDGERCSEGEMTPNKAPSTPSLPISMASMLPIAPNPEQSALASKQFPNIEMIQRHMLSQQFPGLINPLLSGFPGFPGGPPPLPFPNSLQQLLAGTCPKPSMMLNNDVDHQHHSSSNNTNKKAGGGGDNVVAGGAASSKGPQRRFKCSKCQLKFKKRELCLRHIHAQHSLSSSRRRLQFTTASTSPSSKAKSKGGATRSHYVKRLMEILKVPTSRGTPSRENSTHIMQAFLIKKDEVEEANANNEDNFVPSMVYLPVAKRVNQSMTVAFSLTPA
jgi:hypothetical protein